MNVPAPYADTAAQELDLPTLCLIYPRVEKVPLALGSLGTLAILAGVARIMYKYVHNI